MKKKRVIILIALSSLLTMALTASALSFVYGGETIREFQTKSQKEVGKRALTRAIKYKSENSNIPKPSEILSDSEIKKFDEIIIMSEGKECIYTKEDKKEICQKPLEKPKFAETQDDLSNSFSQRDRQCQNDQYDCVQLEINLSNAGVAYLSRDSYYCEIGTGFNVFSGESEWFCTISN